MFLNLVLLSFFLMFFYLWSDYMKLLIFLEFVTLFLLMVLLFGFHFDYFSLSYFLSVLIFLICESSVGFLLFIFYISMESEVVKKISMTQF